MITLANSDRFKQFFTAFKVPRKLE